MLNIWNENQITTSALANYLQDSGFPVLKYDDNRIELLSETGWLFQLIVDTNTTYLKFATYFPLKKKFARESKLKLAQDFNYDLFLGKFFLDSDDDLSVCYQMTYFLGLNVVQFLNVYLRFSSLLDYIYGNDELNNLLACSEKNLECQENQLDGRVPHNTLLN